MDLTLLSGVVRNRKQMASAVSRSHILFENAQAESQTPHNTIDRLRTYLSKTSIFRKFSLRVHKFTFQWELAIHVLICVLSLTPFFFTGRRLYSLIPISVWAFYNVLFLIGPQFANKVIPRFGRVKLSFKSTIEEFFSAKLLPVLSISFLCVVLSLAVTGHRLGGPPLCYHPCGVCLSTWEHSIPLPPALAAALEAVSAQDPSGTGSGAGMSHLPELDTLTAQMDPLVDPYRVGCGFANGKEMLGYYTMGQTSFMLFIIVVMALMVCLAWRVADEERQERRSAEEWLKTENPHAYQLRSQLVDQLGPPGSSVRPEGSAVWIYFGVTAALSFTLLGWHNWYVLPPSNTATLLIILNLLTILMTTLILHLSFFGRLLALYKRNLNRVECLSRILSTTPKEQLDSWWSCRNFVLNDDLSLDYDIGGLAVSATFLIAITLFGALISQIFREGLQAMLEAPGSYLAYACLYITCCLIKLFTLATNTYEEQHRHIAVLQSVSNSLHYQGAMSTDYNEYAQLKHAGGSRLGLNSSRVAEANSMWAAASEDDYMGLQDDGPICIDDDDGPSAVAAALSGAGGAGGGGVGIAGMAGGGAGPGLGAVGGAGAGGGGLSSAGAGLAPLEKPPLSRNSSGTGSPRRLKNKTFASDVGKPVGKGTGAGSGGNSPVSNWLGKTIFGSFRTVGFGSNLGVASRSEEGENEGLLHAHRSSSGDVQDPAAGGGIINDVAPSPVGILKHSGSAANTGQAVHVGPGLPRPHHAGRGFDSKGNPLHIETAHSHGHSHDSATHGPGAPGGVASQSPLVVPTSTGSATNPAVPRISPFGGTKSPHFAPNLILEVPHPSGTSNPAGIATADGTAGDEDLEISPLQELDPEDSFDRQRSQRSDSGVDGEAALTPISSSSDGPGSSGAVVGTGGAGSGAAGASSGGGNSSMPGKPSLLRSVSHNASVESYRQTIMEMISQIRRYDPYPCILGIPVMPALFNSSKFYIFIGFMLIGIRVMVACLRQI